MEWYCIVTGTQRGPMPLADLAALVRDGTLKPEDYVWAESFGNQWRRVRDVPELAPPPVISTVAPAPEFGAGPAPSALPVSQTPLTGVPGKRPSFTLAMREAWERMVAILFRHASFARWMGLAFCVWISIVGWNEPNLAGEILTSRLEPDASLVNKLKEATQVDEIVACSQEIMNEMWEQARQLLTPEVVKTALAIWLVLAVLTCWFRARGAFMVVHRWHHPDATIAQSWAAGRGPGRSLFLFRLELAIVMCALLAAMGMDLKTNVIVPIVNGAVYEGALETRAFLLLLGISMTATVWFTASILVNHFVVPVMYWRRVGLLAAWRAVAAFCNERPGAMTIYLALYLVLLHVLLAALALVMCCTCCCAAYLLIIPFVNGLLLLPAMIFLRGLGISFLRQWRPDLETGGR